ncbi:MAG: DUF3006 domain-containing protein [Trueperaceae bacterium]|nr:DUF3006 domain-containing protein [Trueperaceae bacterium]
MSQDGPSAAGMSYVVDRIVDGAWAVLEDADGGTTDLPVAWLPAGVQEGDVVRVDVTTAAGLPDDAGRSVTFRLDRDATERRRADAAAMRDRLRQAPEGDLDL